MHITIEVRRRPKFEVDVPEYSLVLDLKNIVLQRLNFYIDQNSPKWNYIKLIRKSTIYNDDDPVVAPDFTDGCVVILFIPIVFINEASANKSQQPTSLSGSQSSRNNQQNITSPAAQQTQSPSPNSPNPLNSPTHSFPQPYQTNGYANSSPGQFNQFQQGQNVEAPFFNINQAQNATYGYQYPYPPPGFGNSYAPQQPLAPAGYPTAAAAMPYTPMGQYQGQMNWPSPINQSNNRDPPPANQQLLNKFKEQGYTERSATNALRISFNNGMMAAMLLERGMFNDDEMNKRAEQLLNDKTLNNAQRQQKIKEMLEMVIKNINPRANSSDVKKNVNQCMNRMQEIQSCSNQMKSNALEYNAQMMQPSLSPLDITLIQLSKLPPNQDFENPWRYYISQRGGQTFASHEEFEAINKAAQLDCKQCRFVIMCIVNRRMNLSESLFYLECGDGDPEKANQCLLSSQ